jgi:sulfur carrier protein ThiS
MQVQVKLYGTLGKRVSGYDHRRGLAVEVPEGATVRDLLAQLAIPLKRVGVVSLDGRLAGKKAPLAPGVLVKVFHPIFGG